MHFRTAPDNSNCPGNNSYQEIHPYQYAGIANMLQSKYEHAIKNIANADPYPIKIDNNIVQQTFFVNLHIF